MMSDDIHWWGIDWGSGPALTRQHIAQRIEGMTFVSAVPRELGAVTRLKVFGDGRKITAETESGITMIVPTGKRTAT